MFLLDNHLFKVVCVGLYLHTITDAKSNTYIFISPLPTEILMDLSNILLTWLFSVHTCEIDTSFILLFIYV